MLAFVLPTEQNRSDVLSFYSEIENSGGACIGIGNYRDYALWLNGMQNRRTGEKLPNGFERVLCVCDNDNCASERVILKNGGVFESELFDPAENVTVKRYWIWPQ